MKWTDKNHKIFLVEKQFEQFEFNKAAQPKGKIAANWNAYQHIHIENQPDEAIYNKTDAAEHKQEIIRSIRVNRYLSSSSSFMIIIIIVEFQ